MQHIQGISRHQLQMSSLEDKITVDNPVRFIEAFVNHIDAVKLGFQSKVLKTEGRPGFRPEVFLKLYLYGYLNGVRSSRRLERECFRNIEVQWLLEDLCPNYHSIADFRKDNPKALKQLFKLFVSFLKDADLIAGETIAIDGTKSRAHNSKKANFNQKKIDKHKEYIDAKSQEYLEQLEQNDIQENPVAIKNIQQKIERLKQNKIKYERLEEELKKSGEPQISTTDSDARVSVKPGKARQLNYFGQIAVDDAHHVITGACSDFADKRDSQCLEQIVELTEENLKDNDIELEELLADGGYSSGEALPYLREKSIDAYIPNFGQYKPEREGFVFNKEENYYQCTKPKGNRAKLLFKGEKTDSKGYTKHTYRSSESDCKNCPLRAECCGKSTKFKKLDDSIHKEHYDRMHQKLTRNEKYAKRMSKVRSKTVEPVIGTLVNFTNMKRVNTRGIKNANKHVLMASLTYNLKKYLRFIVKKPSVLAQVISLKQGKHFAFLKVTLIGFKNSLLSAHNFSILNYN